MSKSYNTGKPLSGIPNISNSLKNGISNDLLGSISSGITLENVNIQSGSINGVQLGLLQPGPAAITNLTIGSPGNGYTACFFGNITGDSACWLPVSGLWNIQGDLLVRDISDLGSLRISQNTLSSTNTNGNINISPNGSGITTINSGLTLNTISGNISQQTQNGTYYISANTNTITSNSDTSISTGNGDIKFVTGNSRITFNISFITVGTTFTTVTTTLANSFIIGQKVIFTNTNSTPNINGTYIITSITSTTSFTVSLTVPITISGTTGNVQLTNNIYLSSSNNIFVPQNIPIVFGTNTNSPNLVSDGINTTLTSQNVIVNGNFTVNGTTTTANSTVVTIQDPVINLGGTSVYTSSDFMDRGVSFRYFNGVSKIGFFGRSNSTGCLTYIPDAIESGNVYSGTPGCVTFGLITGTNLNLQNGAITNTSNITSTNLTVTGTSSINNLSITGTTTGITLNQIISIEHLNNTVMNPSNTINTTFVKVSTAVTATGTMTSPTIDGFEKKILCSGLVSGSMYRLYFPTGLLLDPDTGTTIAKYLDFDSPGMSCHMIWDNTIAAYIIIAASVCAHT